MPLLLRLFSLISLCGTLTSCGTASHYLGQASGLVNSITSPVLGALRLSDTPERPADAPESAVGLKSYDPRRTSAKRPH